MEDGIMGTMGLMEHFHISRRTVQRLLAKGMPRTKVGTRNCFTEEQMTPWFNANRALDPWNWPVSTFIRKDTRIVRAMFREFNKTFWRNRLPQYDVRVVREISDDRTLMGNCNTVEKQILIHWDMESEEDGFRCTVLHEMCHAADPQDLGHGWRFGNQLRRLQRMGEEWAEEEWEEFCGNGAYGRKWRDRVQKRMFECAGQHPEWTWDEAWKHLGEEFSVDPTKLSDHFPKHKFTWTEMGELIKKRGELIKERIDTKKQIRRLDKLIKAAEAQQ